MEGFHATDRMLDSHADRRMRPILRPLHRRKDGLGIVPGFARAFMRQMDRGIGPVIRSCAEESQIEPKRRRVKPVLFRWKERFQEAVVVDRTRYGRGDEEDSFSVAERTNAFTVWRFFLLLS